MPEHTETRAFVSLGMFIIDEFSFADENGNPTGKTLPPQIGGGGVYATVGARIWLPSSKVGMIIDKGNDFPTHMRRTLNTYGLDMWYYREQPDVGTTRALNAYRGERRGFEYLTPRIRITPRDLAGTALERPQILHFICSPTRASAILGEVLEDPTWQPITVYEPIPDRCVPEELPALQKALPSISILSPNAEEALSLLSMPLSVTKESVEGACGRFLDLGVGKDGEGYVIIRSGPMGACMRARGKEPMWVPAFWSDTNKSKVVDVTGAGNAFLGGLGAGLTLTNNSVEQAVLYATVSASYTIEQEGLPHLTTSDEGSKELWNGDLPHDRLSELQGRLRPDGSNVVQNVSQ